MYNNLKCKCLTILKFKDEEREVDNLSMDLKSLFISLCFRTTSNLALYAGGYWEGSVRRLVASYITWLSMHQSRGCSISSSINTPECILNTWHTWPYYFQQLWASCHGIINPSYATFLDTSNFDMHHAVWIIDCDSIRFIKLQ